MPTLPSRLLRRRARPAQDGFTLAELVIVISVIGILLLIAVPSYLGYRERSEEAAAKADLREASRPSTPTSPPSRRTTTMRAAPRS